jgi:hypothetical protein
LQWLTLTALHKMAYHEMSQVNPCWICGVQNYNVTGLSPITSVFPDQYKSTTALYSFFHLSLTGSAKYQQLTVLLNGIGLSPLPVPYHCLR